MIVSFTGHRPDKLGGWDPLHPAVTAVRKALRDALALAWPERVLSGMAVGVDQWAAETCVELGIPFVAALPCDAVDSAWPQVSRARYQALLKKATEIVVVSPGQYKPWKMQRRNEYLVDHCDLLMAVHDGSSGGTKNTLVYAEQVGRKVMKLPWRDVMDRTDSMSPRRDGA